MNSAIAGASTLAKNNRAKNVRVYKNLYNNVMRDSSMNQQQIRDKLRLGDGSTRDMLQIGNRAVESSIMFKTGQAFFKAGQPGYFSNAKPSIPDHSAPKGSQMEVKQNPGENQIARSIFGKPL